MRGIRKLKITGRFNQFILNVYNCIENIQAKHNIIKSLYKENAFNHENSIKDWSVSCNDFFPLRI